jgi:hypothetical protein
MANPRVRPHLRFYPEDAGKHVSEYWHARHWHQDANPMRLTPMAVIGSQQFWTFEPCVLKTGAVVMPSRWFIRDQVMHAVAWTLQPYRSDGQVTGWIVEEYNNVVVSQSDFLLPFASWGASSITTSLPDPKRILGAYLNTFYLLY